MAETPPPVLTVIELTDGPQPMPFVGGMWKAKRPADDQVSIAVAPELLVHGTPAQIIEWVAQIGMVASEAERTMIADRVQDGRATWALEL